MADNVFRLISAVIINAWVVRYLGPTSYGDLAYSIAFVAMFTPLATVGLTDIVVRDLVAHPEQRAQTMGSAFALMVAGALVATIISALAIFAVRPNDDVIQKLVLVQAVGVLFQPATVIDAWFKSQVASKYVVYARNAALIVVSVIKIIGVVLQAPLLLFAIMYTLESGICAAGLAVVYAQQNQGTSTFRNWQVRAARAVELLRDSWPLLFTGLAIVIYMRIDQAMLGQMLPGDEGRREVGLYAAAVRLSELWFFVPVAITSSLFPSVVRSKALGKEDFNDRVQRLFSLMVLVAYTFAIPLTFLSGTVVEVFYGADYSDSALMLTILAWAGVWVSLGTARSAVINAEKRQILLFKTSLIGALSNVFLNLLFIPSMGGIGSAIATVMSYSVSAYISSFLFPSLVHWGKMQTLALVFPNPLKGRRHG